jgi:hypothetical protein
MLASVRFGGRDLADTALDVPDDDGETTGVQLLVTSRSAQVTGDVVDAHGAPLGNCTIVVFSTEAARWGAGTRFVAAARPDLDGHFVVRGLPGGEYFVAAREDLDDEAWQDPRILQALAAEASRLTLVEGASQEVALTIDMR